MTDFHSDIKVTDSIMKNNLSKNASTLHEKLNLQAVTFKHSYRQALFRTTTTVGQTYSRYYKVLLHMVCCGEEFDCDFVRCQQQHNKQQFSSVPQTRLLLPWTSSSL